MKSSYVCNTLVVEQTSFGVVYAMELQKQFLFLYLLRFIINLSQFTTKIRYNCYQYWLPNLLLQCNFIQFPIQMKLRPHSTKNRNKSKAKLTKTQSQNKGKYSPQKIEQYLTQQKNKQLFSTSNTFLLHQDIQIYKQVKSIPVLYAYKPTQLNKVLVESPKKYRNFFKAHPSCSYGRNHIEPLLRHFKQWKKHIRQKLMEVFVMVLEEPDSFREGLQQKVVERLCQIQGINKGLKLSLKEMLQSNVNNVQISNLYDSFIYTEQYISKVVSLIECIYTFCDEVNGIMQKHKTNFGQAESEILQLKKQYQKKVSQILFYCAKHPESTLLNRMEFKIKYKFDVVAKESLTMFEFVRKGEQLKERLTSTLKRLEQGSSNKQITNKMLQNIYVNLLQIDEVKKENLVRSIKSDNQNQQLNAKALKYEPQNNRLSSKKSRQLHQNSRIKQNKKSHTPNSHIQFKNQQYKQKQDKKYQANDLKGQNKQSRNQQNDISNKVAGSDLNIKTPNKYIHNKLKQLLQELQTTQQLFLQQLKRNSLDALVSDRQKLQKVEILLLIKNKAQQYRELKKKLIYLAKIYRSRKIQTYQNEQSQLQRCKGKTDQFHSFGRKCGQAVKNISQAIQNIIEVYDQINERVKISKEQIGSKLSILQFILQQVQKYQRQQENVKKQLKQFTQTNRTKIQKDKQIILQNVNSNMASNVLSDPNYFTPGVIILHNRYGERQQQQQPPSAKQSQLIQQLIEILKFSQFAAPEFQIFRKPDIKCILNLSASKQRQEIEKHFAIIRERNNQFLSNRLPIIFQSKVSPLKSYARMQLFDILLDGDRLQKQFIQGFQNIKNAQAIQSQSLLGITSIFANNKSQLNDQSDTFFKRLLFKYRKQTQGLQNIKKGYLIHHYINELLEMHLISYCDIQSAQDIILSNSNRYSKKDRKSEQKDNINSYISNIQIRNKLQKTLNRLRLILTQLQLQDKKMRKSVVALLKQDQERNKQLFQQKFQESIFKVYLCKQIARIQKFIKRQQIFSQLEVSQFNNVMHPSIEFIYNWSKFFYEYYINNNNKIMLVQSQHKTRENNKRLQEFKRNHLMSLQNLQVHLVKLQNLIKSESSEEENPNEQFLETLLHIKASVQSLKHSCKINNYQGTMLAMLAYLRDLDIWHIGLFANNNECIILMPWDQYGLLRQIERIFQMEPYSIDGVQNFENFDIQDVIATLLNTNVKQKQMRDSLVQATDLNQKEKKPKQSKSIFASLAHMSKKKQQEKKAFEEISQDILKENQSGGQMNEEIQQEQPQFILEIESAKKKKSKGSNIVQQDINQQNQLPIEQLIKEQQNNSLVDQSNGIQKHNKESQNFRFLIGSKDKNNQQSKQPRFIIDQHDSQMVSLKKKKNYSYFKLPMIDSPQSVRQFIEFNKNEKLIIEETVDIETLMQCLEPTLNDKNKILNHIKQVLLKSSKKCIIGILNTIKRYTRLQQMLIQFSKTVDQVNSRRDKNTLEYRQAHYCMVSSLLGFFKQIGIQTKVLYGCKYDADNIQKQNRKYSQYDCIMILRKSKSNNQGGGYYCKVVLVEEEASPMDKYMRQQQQYGIDQFLRQFYEQLYNESPGKDETSKTVSIKGKKDLLRLNNQIESINNRLESTRSPFLRQLNAYQDYLIYNSKEATFKVNSYLRRQIGEPHTREVMLQFIPQQAAYDKLWHVILDNLLENIAQIKGISIQYKYLIFQGYKIFCCKEQANFEPFLLNTLKLSNKHRYSIKKITKGQSQNYQLTLQDNMEKMKKRFFSIKRILIKDLLNALYGNDKRYFQQNIKIREQTIMQFIPFQKLHNFNAKVLSRADYNTFQVQKEISLLKYAQQIVNFINPNPFLQQNTQKQENSLFSKHFLTDGFIIKSDSSCYQRLQSLPSKMIKQMSDLLSSYCVSHVLVKSYDNTPLAILQKQDQIQKLKQLLGIAQYSQNLEKIFIDSLIIGQTNEANQIYRKQIKITEFCLFLQFQISTNSDRHYLKYDQYIQALKGIELLIVHQQQIRNEVPVSPISFLSDSKTSINPQHDKQAKVLYNYEDIPTVQRYVIADLLQDDIIKRKMYSKTPFEKYNFIVKIRTAFPKNSLKIELRNAQSSSKNKLQEIRTLLQKKDYNYYDKLIFKGANQSICDYMNNIIDKAKLKQQQKNKVRQKQQQKRRQEMQMLVRQIEKQKQIKLEQDQKIRVKNEQYQTVNKQKTQIMRQLINEQSQNRKHNDINNIELQKTKIINRIMQEKQEEDLDISFLLTQGWQVTQINFIELQKFKRSLFLKQKQLDNQSLEGFTLSQMHQYNEQRLNLLQHNSQFQFQDIEQLIYKKQQRNAK